MRSQCNDVLASLRPIVDDGRAWQFRPIHFRETRRHSSRLRARCLPCLHCADWRAYRPWLSSPFAANRRQAVDTIEGLTQRSSSRAAVQCGFCSSGMLLTAYELMSSGATLSRAEIGEYISGNVCRCTGYQAICRCGGCYYSAAGCRSWPARHDRGVGSQSATAMDARQLLLRRNSENSCALGSNTCLMNTPRGRIRSPKGGCGFRVSQYRHRALGRDHRSEVGGTRLSIKIAVEVVPGWPRTQNRG